MIKDNGGPAFPTPAHNLKNDGMHLRDHLESENAKQAVMLNKVIEQRDEAIFNHQAETACSDQLFAQLEAMTQQRDELLAALAFYANDEVYKSDSIGRPIDIAYVARAAIAKVKP